MQRQGSEVVVATDYGGLRGKELENTEKIGAGMLDRISIAQAYRECIGEQYLWVFDNNDLPDIADDLRAKGEAVIGTSKLAKKLENDREYGTQVAEHLGFDLPRTEEFTDYDTAIAFLDDHADQAFVYKPDAQDPTATYVPLAKDDPEGANEELRQYLEALKGTANPKFILQEQVHGTEVNFELWLSDGRPLVGFCDLESKRKLVGDLGENAGCAGGYVFPVPLDTPLVQETVGRYLAWPELQHYTGSVDANVILADDKFYFLENCFRFGYNAYPTIFHALARIDAEALLWAWVRGEDVSQAFADGIGGSLSLGTDHPHLGCPILLNGADADTYLYRAYQDDTGVHMVAQWPEILCVTALGSTLEEAGALCLERAEQIAFPAKGYRTDLLEASLPTLPAARWQRLAQMGLSLPVPTT